MDNYSIGVLGGMGPFATSVFFNRIIMKTHANKDQDHHNVLILNHSTIPDRTTIIEQAKSDLFLNSIKKDISILNEHAQFIAIPCNTSHYFISDIENMATIPVLNMVQLTVNKIKQSFPKKSKIAVLATDGTINTRVYENALHNESLNYVKVDDDIQQEVMQLIYDFKKNSNADTSYINTMIKNLIQHKDYDCIILACTELSCMPYDSKYSSFIIDALDVLVDESIKRANEIKIKRVE